MYSTRFQNKAAYVEFNNNLGELSKIQDSLFANEVHSLEAIQDKLAEAIRLIIELVK